MRAVLKSDAPAHIAAVPSEGHHGQPMLECYRPQCSHKCVIFEPLALGAGAVLSVGNVQRKRRVSHAMTFMT